MRWRNLCSIAVVVVLCAWLAASASERETSKASSAAGMQLDLYALGGGGDLGALSPSFQLGITIGEFGGGQVTSDSWLLGIGLWPSQPVACLVIMTGDVNNDGVYSAADIIVMVNYVFKSGAAPEPCEASGDVNCDGSVTAADVIYMVNHVFKGQDAPCDICEFIPSMWTCQPIPQVVGP